MSSVDQQLRIRMQSLGRDLGVPHSSWVTPACSSRAHSAFAVLVVPFDDYGGLDRNEGVGDDDARLHIDRALVVLRHIFHQWVWPRQSVVAPVALIDPAARA